MKMPAPQPRKKRIEMWLSQSTRDDLELYREFLSADSGRRVSMRYITRTMLIAFLEADRGFQQRKRGRTPRNKA